MRFLTKRHFSSSASWLLAVWGIILLILAPWLFQKGIWHPPGPRRSDATAAYVPWRVPYRESVQEGIFPLWDPVRSRVLLFLQSLR
jgi:hypothetical protein